MIKYHIMTSDGKFLYDIANEILYYPYSPSLSLFMLIGVFIVKMKRREAKGEFCVGPELHLETVHLEETLCLLKLLASVILHCTD